MKTYKNLIKIRYTKQENIFLLSCKINNIKDYLLNTDMRKRENKEILSELCKCKGIRSKIVNNKFTGIGLGGKYSRFE